MKTYTVTPGSDLIAVSDGRTLGKNPIAWGRLCGLPGAELAHRIVFDVLGDDPLSRRIAQRFKHRTIEGWDKAAACSIDEDEVRAVIASILEVEQDKGIRTAVSRAARERPEYVTDRPDKGQGYRSNPEITPGKLEKKNGQSTN